MPYSKAIFNKSGRWHWWFNDNSDLELDLHLSSVDLEQQWFVAELFYPHEPDHDVRIYYDQITRLLSKPNELASFNPSQELKASILSLERYRAGLK